MATLLASPRPAWARQWPDVFDREWTALRDAGAKPVIAEEPSTSNELAIDVSWPLGERMVPLRIQYPGSYPWTRPQVRLLSRPESYPTRHCSPLDGNLCLLGRDTGQWNPNWTAAELISKQLEHALNDTGEQDPQGEPAEFWWNVCARETAPSYCLVDSSFDPGLSKGGSLKLAYRLEKLHPLNIRACVIEARDGNGSVLATMNSPLGEGGDVIVIPWVHLDKAFTPAGSDTPAKISALLRAHPQLADCKAQRFGSWGQGRFVAVSYPMEIDHERTGAGWLFLYRPGKNKPAEARQGAPMVVVRTLRAGPADLLCRNLEAGSLHGKSVAVFGAGSLGAPVILELAKNGCAELRIVDHDLVEPGNSVRWPLGVGAWGREKVQALRDFIQRNYPSCKVTMHSHFIGMQPGDEEMVASVLDGAHLVIDVTAAIRVTQWLGMLCQSAGLPLVSAYATPDLAGGRASIFMPNGGCPRCLQWATDLGEIDGPPGGDLENELIQPPGCSERTFRGAGYDVQELGLQTVRMAVAALSAIHPASTVATLTFDRSHAVRLPSWKLVDLGRQPRCGCGCGR